MTGIRFELKHTKIGIFKCSNEYRIDCKYKSIYDELPIPPIELFNSNTRCYFTLQGYRKFKSILKEYYKENKEYITVIKKRIKEESIIYKDEYQYVVNNN